MKIVQLDIQGFRSLKNVSWRPGDLNVIIGPNGSGKSNLLRMLEMISAAARGRLSRFIQAESGFGAVLWDGRAESIEFRIAMSQMPEVAPTPLEMVQILPDHPKTPPRFAYSIELLPFGKGASYRVGQELLQDEENQLVYLTRHGLIAQAYTRNGRTSVRPDHVDEEEAILPATISPYDELDEKQSLISQIEPWSIYPTFRTDQDAPIRQAQVSRLEQSVAPDGQNLINVLHTLYTRDRQFKQDINDAMSAAFGTDFDELVFPPDSGDQRIQMRVRWKTLKRDQSTADLSDGTLRFLFLMTVLAAPNPPPLIAIDEPETGLHPSALPIIAEFAAEAATRTQVIFTTHSAGFLDAFRDTKPTMTVAKLENGETILKTIPSETLDYWVQGYTLGSLFRSGELEELD